MSFFFNKFDNAEILPKNSFTIFNGIKIVPAKLILHNAYEGKSFKEKITFQNVTQKPVQVTTNIPKSYYYQFDKSFRKESVSCGLALTLWLKHTYTCVAPSVFHIQVQVNEQIFDYEIRVVVSQGSIEIEPRTVDFGKINSGHAVHVRTLRLCNRGSTQSKFQFDLPPNNLGLSIVPRGGFLLSRCCVDVYIDLIGFEEGSYNKEIWIKCTTPVRFNIIVDVIKPHIELCSPVLNTLSFMPIIFRPCYGGSREVKNLEVINFNMLESTFIIVPEYKYVTMGWQKAKKLDPDYNLFKFNPVAGNLKPNEKKTIEITFEPKPMPLNEPHFLCFRVVRLNCENVTKIEGDVPQDTEAPGLQMSDVISLPSASSLVGLQIQGIRSSMNIAQITNENVDDSIRICLYAITNSVKVTVEPVQFTLAPMAINTKREVSLNIKNNSTRLPINFEYEKISFIDIIPKKGCIAPLACVPLKVVFAPKAAGDIEKQIRINLLYPVQHYQKIKPILCPVGFVDIPVYIPVTISTTQLPPKFNMGITPMLTNEVGFLTDDIRFNTDIKKPKMAMQLLYECKPEKINDASKIAFPNDRPTCLQPWRNRKVKCLTIFAELPRVIAPKDKYMLSNKELCLKLANNQRYQNYITELRQERCKNNNIFEDYITDEHKLMESCAPVTCVPHYKRPQDRIISFGPLKPMEIYFVSVQPSRITIGSVLVNSETKYIIEIHNENDFPVNIFIKSFHRHKEMLSDLPDEFVIKAFEKKVVTKTFNSLNLGLFNTVINVYLNKRHLIPVVMQAEIVTPVLSLDSMEYVFDDNNPDHSKVITIMNILNATISYNWNLDEDSCYDIYPTSGTIPPGRHMYTELTFTPNYKKRYCTNMSLVCKNGSTQIVVVNAGYAFCHVDVQEHSIHVPNIPLNILVQKTNMLRNQSNELVLFKIKNPNPCLGVTIEPEQGQIFGKTDAVLTINILFDSLVKFECSVDIEFEYGQKKHFLLSGSVDVPNIVFYPSNIQFKRIPAGSFELVPFEIVNKGPSLVHLRFLKHIYPEINVSRCSEPNTVSENDLEFTLQRKESIKLYAQFSPLDVMMDDMYLPIVINNLLGPATKLDEESIYLKNYVKILETNANSEDETVHPLNLKLKKMKIPVLKMSLFGSKNILRISKTVLQFKYHSSLPMSCLKEQEIKVTNSDNNPTEFLIDVSLIKPYFQIKCETPENLVYEEEGQTQGFVIEPQEEIVFTVKFIPTKPVEVSCKIPMYIKDVKDGYPFNCLLLKAQYRAPIIKAPEYYHIEPVPLNVLITCDIFLTLSNHFFNCKISVDYESDYLRVFFLHDARQATSISGPDVFREITMKMTFISNVPVHDSQDIRIMCTCNAETTMSVTYCSSDDILTSYTCRTPLMENKTVITARGFTLFPPNEENSELATYMRRCVTTVERWIYDQVLQSTYYYFIPDDMCGFIKGKKGFSNTLVLTQIMDNLCGVGKELVPSKPLPTDDLQRVNELHTNFRSLLGFLIELGACFPHCRSRYMLNYKDYYMYMTKVRKFLKKPVDKIRSEKYFYRRSKQVWLDVLLSLFKVVILSKSKLNINRRLSRTSELQSVCTSFTPEQSLLAWLNFIYQQEKHNLLTLDDSISKKFELLGTVKNYTSHLKNSLVFIAVTIHYCPFLKPYLQNIYIDTANSPEKCFHNALALLNCWKLLHHGFTITASEIVNPIALQMLFLVTYMADFFTSMYPKEEISFYTGLSLKETKEITIRNPNNIEIVYEIIFLDNNLNCFRAITNGKFFKIGPNKTTKLKIEFWAKRLQNQKTTLILCGDVPGCRFSKSMTYLLNGKSHFKCPHIVKVFEVDLYKSVQVDEPLQAPYKEATSYDSLCSKRSPDEVKIEHLIPTEVYLKHIQPRTLYTEHWRLITNKKGEGIMHMSVCCLSTVTFNATIVFVNPEVGDFFICIQIVPVNFDLIEKYVIKVDLPADFNQRECNCCDANRLTNPEKCPKRLVVEIPSKNDPFWNIITTAVMQSVPPLEKNVWEQVIGTVMGPHLLRWLLSDQLEQKTIDHLLSKNMVYKVNNPSTCLILPDTITIPNIRADEVIPIDMHLRCDIDKVKQLFFSLESQDSTEFRWYTLEFEKKPGSRKSTGSSVNNRSCTSSACYKKNFF